MIVIARLSFAAEESPPSRGAWIEIKVDWESVGETVVAPLAGGVD